MAWIESHTVLVRHRKLIELARELRLRPVYTMGHLHALWHAALEQQEDGDLSKWSDGLIAESSDFPGDAPQYVRLLQKHEWLDGKVIHDWLEYAGRYLESRYRSSDPERLVGIWAIHGKLWDKIPGRQMNQGWVVKRKEILERDGYACKECSATQRLEVHHINPLALGGTDDDENLETLCKKCHSKRPRLRVSKTGVSPDNLTNLTNLTNQQLARVADPEPYKPSSDRAVKAVEALAKCVRVRLKEPSVLDAWCTAYPDVNLATEILKADAWGASKAVTRSPAGWQRTMNTWLSKAQDEFKRPDSKDRGIRATEGKYAGIEHR